MKKNNLLIGILSIGAIAIASILILKSLNKSTDDTDGYLGSKSCIECHERFYNLWAPSHHGLAMQEVDSLLIARDSIPQSEVFKIEGAEYQAIVKNDSLFMLEITKNETRTFHSSYVCGGKYIYYFLIPLERGKLQVMPLAYDLRRKEWYNNPQSGVRHFVEGPEDDALDWRSSMFTFNSNCIACHSSQYDIGYDMESNTYHTSWKEPGINCEACHGPSQEHAKLFSMLPKGETVEDTKLIMTTYLDNERNNSACLNCHAQMRPLTQSFNPGDRFFDHYNLIALEDNDFHPDGRDLGENFTMTLWEMNKCNSDGELTCMRCHTSSGRYRFAEDKIANDACMPCHKAKVANPEKHTHHPAGEDGIKCINCHMPKTEFARMDRSDHSHMPPMPQATIEFGSPNACNICHDNKSPEWANAEVKKWHKDDYQKDHIYRAQLVVEARKQDWTRIDEMLAYIKNNPEDKIYLTSLIRLLTQNTEDKKWPFIIEAATNTSPMVRSAAIHELALYPDAQAKSVVIAALTDDYRAVRVEGGYAFHYWPKTLFTETEILAAEKALNEYEETMTARPDDWSALYNLGNYYSEKNELKEAIIAYNKSLNLSPNELITKVNLGMSYAYAQNYTDADKQLAEALKIDPENETVLLNYALLQVEMQRFAEAEAAYRKLHEVNPKSGKAAYNIAIMVAERDINEAEKWAKIAAKAEPNEANYTYTYAYYLVQNKKMKLAQSVLNKMIEKQPAFVDSYLYLAQLYIESGENNMAIKLLKQGLAGNKLNAADKVKVQQVLGQLN